MNGPVRRVLVLGGTSEIGVAIMHALQLPSGSEVILAGRDADGLAVTARALPATVAVTTTTFDALSPASVGAVVEGAFARGRVDLVIPAFGVLGDQAGIEKDPASGDELLTVNVVAQARAVMESARLLREQGSGTIVVLSSVASVRPRRANFVYGASKAALDALARGLQDSLHGSGAGVLLVRPGFVIGRMTAGMAPAPLSTTPSAVAEAVVDGLAHGRSVVWVPRSLRLLAVMLRLLPRPLWRRVPR